MLANFTEEELKMKGVNISAIQMAQKIAEKMSRERVDAAPQVLLRKRTSILLPNE